jgi:hypothetical protein
MDAMWQSENVRFHIGHGNLLIFINGLRDACKAGQKWRLNVAAFPP